MRESIIEKYLTKRVKAVGGAVRKLKWIGRKGAPDRFVMLIGKSFFCELKAPGEEPDIHQQCEIAILRASGNTVHVIDSKEGVDKVLNEKI